MYKSIHKLISAPLSVVFVCEIKSEATYPKDFKVVFISYWKSAVMASYL